LQLGKQKTPAHLVKQRAGCCGIWGFRAPVAPPAQVGHMLQTGAVSSQPWSEEFWQVKLITTSSSENDLKPMGRFPDITDYGQSQSERRKAIHTRTSLPCLNIHHLLKEIVTRPIN
jgi:hypothetical protein